jgi:hypothetical protein
MGIDIRIESTIDSKWNELLGSTGYCKCTWANADIAWVQVFQFVHFDPTRLYGNTPNFWTWEQLAVVLANLNKLSTNPEYFAHDYSDWDVNAIISYTPSIDKLIGLFTEYVDKKCNMYIY